MSETIEIEGLAELSEILSTLAPAAAKRYMSKVAEPAAEVVLEAMHQTVPVGVGILEEALGWQKHFRSEDGETAMEIIIGPLKGFFWGSLTEFGTKFQPGQHWFSRAWESSKDRTLDVFATEAVGILLDLSNRR